MMVQFFNSSTKIVQRSEIQKEREGSPNTCQNSGRQTVRSTGVHNVHRSSSVDRPVDRSMERSTDWHA